LLAFERRKWLSHAESKLTVKDARLVEETLGDETRS
jgi:hypothetical protein